jgi:anti-sigma regulatory factor (Ser/Thr protein kinase)
MRYLPQRGAESRHPLGGYKEPRCGHAFSVARDRLLPDELVETVDDHEPLVLDVPALPQSAGPVRRALRDLIPSSAGQDLRDTAALLVTELVTNAARHVGGVLRVRAAMRTDVLLVEVSDTSSLLPQLTGLPSLDSESGRGLVLVDALADRWGADLLPTGKRVWFELKLA